MQNMPNVHIVQLSPLVIPEDSNYKRDEIRPFELQQRNYKDNYDYKTLAYDVFQKYNKIIFSGPPLYGVESLIDNNLILLNKVKIPKKSISSILLNRIQRNYIISDIKMDTFTLKIENQYCEVNINNNQTLKFKDKKVLLTLSKNNKLTWIKDWILFYYNNHDINSVLLYDNNSTEYQIDDIKKYLVNNLSIDIEIYIVPWNFQYGPLGYDSEKNIELPWDSDFCQYGMLEHAKERFLSLAAGVINADIDEFLITPKNRSIFTYLDIR